MEDSTPSFEEASFFHPVYNTELNVAFDGDKVYMTFYDKNGRPSSKLILTVSDKVRDAIAVILEDYQRKE